jgi:UDP-GlcNAc:undecaprenyl-phosphate GlcNAc-1-phosphate transferase
MVGMINAINHSDGLDGLAGGESMLSLGGIAYLSYLAGGTTVTVMALATIGGLFGFMRFNTHPARIFMGDGGSQFLGYTLGFLAVLLTQKVNPVLSPALPALLLGLPIADYRCLCAADLPQGKLVPRHQEPHPSSPAESRVPTPRIRGGCLFGAGAAGLLCGAHPV